MLGIRGVEQVEDVGVDGAGGEGLEGEGGDELFGVFGHGDGDASAALDELGADLGGFIGGDAAADGEDDLAAFEDGGGFTHLWCRLSVCTCRLKACTTIIWVEGCRTPRNPGRSCPGGFPE